jgi:hypothetical protein
MRGSVAACMRGSVAACMLASVGSRDRDVVLNASMRLQRNRRTDATTDPRGIRVKFSVFNPERQPLRKWHGCPKRHLIEVWRE